MDATNYQCNVEAPPGKTENLGCGKIFQSSVDLPPVDRLCPVCKKKG